MVSTVSGPSSPARTAVRSVGMKFLAICAMSALMMIPVYVVKGLVSERAQRADSVSQEIGDVLGGRQAILGPSVIVPYTVPAAKVGDATTPGYSGNMLISPERGDISGKVVVEDRRRSLFKVPVYKTDLMLKAKFNLPDIQAQAPQGAVLDWARAQLIVATSSAKGALEDIVFQVNGQATTADPIALAGIVADKPAGPDSPDSYGEGDGKRSTPYGFGVYAGAQLRPGASFDVSTRMRFSGAEELAVLTFAKSTSVQLSSNWADPSFVGGFLPQTRKIEKTGFHASWNVPYIARGVAGVGTLPTLSAQLNKSAPIIEFTQGVSTYQPIVRSLKYALLFIGIVFLTYFLFEITSDRRVHVAQYVLIGLSQVIFYLLLLSFSERIGFDLAFFVSASATVGLIALYAASIFNSRKQGLLSFLLFGVLYGLIYVLMSLEDYALMVGSIAAFCVIAAVMYFTKGIDWYGIAQPGVKTEPTLSKETA